MGNCSAWCAMKPFSGLWRGARAIPYFPYVGAAIISIKGVFKGAKFEPKAAGDCNHSTAVHADDRLPVALPLCSKGSRFMGMFVMRHQTLTREEL